MFAYKLLVNCYLKLHELEKAQQMLSSLTAEVFSKESDAAAHYLLECAIQAIANNF